MERAVRILNNAEIEQILCMKDCIAVLEETYVDLAHKKVVNVQRVDVSVPTSKEGEYFVFKTMSGVIPRFDVAALRINSDIYRWPVVGGAARKEIVPAACGGKYMRFVMVFSASTGELEAIFPDGFMQKMRVGATNGLGIKHASREDSEVVGLIGSGWQAGAQLEAACAVRKVRKVRVFSPTREKREAFAEGMALKVGTEVEAVSNARECCRGSDIVITATNSMVPVFDADWIEAGMHVTSLKRQEVDERIFERCDAVVLNSRAHLHQVDYTIGEPEEVPELGLSRGRWFDEDEKVPPNTVDLCDVVAGKVQARRKAGDITFFMNNLGLGMQFAALGSVILKRGRERGIGREVPLDWFAQEAHS